jgi:hypothetical protein
MDFARGRFQESRVVRIRLRALNTAPNDDDLGIPRLALIIFHSFDDAPVRWP